MEKLLLFSGVILCLGWWVMYGRVVKTIFSLKELGDVPVNEPDSFPSLSIIVPACNEAENIVAAVTSLLQQDYPSLQIVLVDDRSEDGTGVLVDQLAGDERVKAVHIKALPEEWLGKVHAESVALQHADGEWVLFTDADIHFEQGILKKAISYALEKKLDHLALMPNVVSDSYWLEVIIRSFGLLFLFSTKVHEVERADKKAVIGVGAFNLVRRSKLDESKGLEWLRMEVADDVGVGMLVKDAGGRSSFAMARKMLSVAWYPGIRAMFSGLEKNLFGAGAHYQLIRMLLIVMLMWSLVFAPFLMVWFSPVEWMRWLAGITLLWLPVLSLIGHYMAGARLSMGLFNPLGQLMISLMMLHAAMKCTWQGGIRWRGTLYKTEQLKKYQRIRF